MEKYCKLCLYFRPGNKCELSPARISSKASLVDCLIGMIDMTFLHELLHIIEPSLTDSQLKYLPQLLFGREKG